MIDIQKKVDCCGCNACGDVCSHHAISFKTDEEGFWYPEVDKDKCVECHLCEKVCPIINVESLKKNDFDKPKCYAGEHKNLEVVFGSTSGGIFSALAEKMLKDKGYIGGAVFNDDFSVRQILSPEKDDLLKIRGSKYVQSDFSGFYIKVRELLLKGEKVLVCGGPCQMAALRAFLKKDYENLIILDYICLGINSPKVWKFFLESIEKKYGSELVGVRAKSKELGWKNLTYKFTFANGKEVFETKTECDFQKGYLGTRVFCRPSCYECKFKGYPRISDITLADYWGIHEHPMVTDKNLGTSLIMVNSQKGLKFFDTVKSRLVLNDISLEEAESGNLALHDSIKSKVDRKEFFHDLEIMTFEEVAKKYIRNSSKTHKRLKAIKNYLRYVRDLARYTQLRPQSLYKLFKYNTLREIISKNVVVATPYTIMDIKKGAKVEKNGMVVLGLKRFKGSKLETRILVEKGGVLKFNGPSIVSYGADIEVFKNSTLEIGGNGYANIGLTIICGGNIRIGDRVFFGRNVTIRDNNGGHYINQFGYKNVRPVIIDDKAWLCEQCIVMPGVKIGTSAIVGARSMVTNNVPAHTMVSGMPAEIVDKNIMWKN